MKIKYLYITKDLFKGDNFNNIFLSSPAIFFYFDTYIGVVRYLYLY